MIGNKVNDMRKLKQWQFEKLKIPNLTFNAIDDYFVGVPELRSHLLKWSGADICGGGLNECLEEVLILADAMRIKFNIVRQFVYE